MSTPLAYLAAALVAGWGLAHAAPTRRVLVGFEPISKDNRSSHCGDLVQDLPSRAHRGCRSADPRGLDMTHGARDSGKRRQRLGGLVLLAAAGAGTVLAGKATLSQGKRGRALFVTGLGVLLVRDTTMIASGSVGRLRTLPAALLVIEPICAGAAITCQMRPRLRAERSPLEPGADRVATRLTTATFAIHTARQAIYLLAGQGRRGHFPGDVGARCPIRRPAPPLQGDDDGSNNPVIAAE